MRNAWCESRIEAVHIYGHVDRGIGRDVLERGKLSAQIAGRVEMDTILVETTWRCNAACSFCYNHWVPEGTGAPPAWRRVDAG